MSPTKPSSYNSKSQNFAFQNLQPINYLKTFNKMLDHITKPSVQLPDSSKQLKTVRLSKFPLHSYYQQMQGILQGGAKKLNQTEKASKKDAELEKLEEKFLDKHYTFVKGALEKIIDDNEAQQNLLLKSKNFYQTNQLKRTGRQYEAEIVKMVKLRSQPKLRSIKTTIDSARKTLQQNTLRVSNYNSVNALNNTSVLNRKHTKQDSYQSLQSSRKPNGKAALAQQGIKNMKTQYSSLTKDETRRNKNSVIQPQVNNQEEHNPIFKKLKQPQKIEQFRNRNNSEIDYILNARKTYMEPNGKISIDSIHPMTDRTHNNQNTTGSNKLQDKKSQRKRIQTNPAKGLKFKLKEGSYEKINENNEDEQEISFAEEQLNSFRKQISGKDQKRNRKDSQQIESIKDDFEDEDQRFFKQVEYLQKQQTKRQQKYAFLVEDKVKQAKDKLNEKIKQVKRFDYSAPKQEPKLAKTKKENH